MLDLNTTFKTVHGTPYKKSFPRDDEDGKNDETLGNVLLNCLAAYPVREKKEVFLVNHVAEKIMSAVDGKVEMNDLEKTFLGDVVFKATFKVLPKGETEGVYLAPLVAQALRAIGIEALK